MTNNPPHPGPIIKQILFDTGLLSPDYENHGLDPTFKGKSLSKLAKDVGIGKWNLGELLRGNNNLTATIAVKLEAYIKDDSVFDAQKLMYLQKDLDYFNAGGKF